MSFESPSSIAIDDIPLRLRPAVRQVIAPQKPPGKGIAEDTCVPPSLVEDKTHVDAKSKEVIGKEKKMVSNKTEAGTTGDEPQHDGVETDDTIQIKVC